MAFNIAAMGIFPLGIGLRVHFVFVGRGLTFGGAYILKAYIWDFAVCSWQSNHLWNLKVKF